MSALTNIFDWPKTTLLNVLDEATHAEGNQFDIVEIGLTDDRDFAIVVISGPHTKAIAQAVRDAQEDWDG
ncbi:hypothetical protein HA052_15015 [Chromobacterium haemolyticum]|uniref:Uncharacterized protein n=1 Tax=Chromobacterium fluminis TaxID=3044269 RepID=A0ABX0L3U1_9NEIS|nr:hypothetical protein [Chromobacterium haemolyticum]NHR06502.1 hypothetical protein [Chromobacterium haemolyticum]